MRRNFLQSDKSRYLITGMWNTVFGYSLGVILFIALTDKLHTAIIALIANLLAITMSFASYKLFVFRTRGNWWREFLKACIVYGNMALVSIGLMWIFIDIFNLNVWFSQALTISLTIIISYFGHKKFTFKKR